jgi:hypothetical protein
MMVVFWIAPKAPCASGWFWRQLSDVKEVLDKCVSLGVQALVDVAGLMAGSKSDQSALYLAARLDKVFVV